MSLQGFDESYYLGVKLAELQSNPATASGWEGKAAAFLSAVLVDSGFTPLTHYQIYGYREGISPNAYFDPDEYKLAKALNMVAQTDLYPDLASAVAAFESAWPNDPYLHYLQYGSREGINPSNSFDESSYYENKLAALKGNPATQPVWGNKTSADLKAFFDSIGITALSHYIMYGAAEGILIDPVPADEKVTGSAIPSQPIQTNPGTGFTLTPLMDAFTGTEKDDILTGLSKTVGTNDSFMDSSTTDVDIANLVIDAAIGSIFLKNVEIVNLDYSAGETVYIDVEAITGAKFINISSTTPGVTSADIAGVSGNANILLTDDIQDLDLEGTSAADDSATITICSDTITITNGGMDIDRDTATDPVENLTIIPGVATTLILGQATPLTTLTVLGNKHIVITGDQVASDLITGKTFTADMTSASATLGIATTAADIDLTAVTGFTFDLLDGNAGNSTISFAPGTANLILSADVNQTSGAFFAPGTTNIATVLLNSPAQTALNFDGFAAVTFEAVSKPVVISSISVQSDTVAGTNGTIVISGSNKVTLAEVEAAIVDATAMTASLDINLSSTIALVKGGSASDTFTAYDGDMTVQGGDGYDILPIAALDLSDNTLALSSVEIITLTGGATLAGNQMNGQRFSINDAGKTLNINGTSLTNGETMDLGAIIILDGTAEAGLTIKGTGFADFITGTHSLQTINGLAGNDTIKGGNSADIILGGTGNDIITPGNSADIITGGAGADTIILTEAVAAIDTLVFTDGFDAMDTIIGFSAGNGGDIVKIAISDLLANVLQVTDLVRRGDASSVVDGSAAIANISSSTDLQTVNWASILAIKGSYATAELLETALETGGDRTLITNNAWGAGDSILVAYSDGTSTYIAAVSTAAGVANDATFAPGSLTVSSLIKLSGITDATTVIAGNLSFIE